MKAIRYSIHFPALIVAAVVFWFAKDLRFPLWISNFNFLHYGLMGALHATAIVVSLRGWKASRLIIGLFFIFLAAVWSAWTPIFGLWSSDILLAPFRFREPHPEFGFTFILIVGSAIGSAGYWLLVRLFWFQSFRWACLLGAMALCAGATFLCSIVSNTPNLSTDAIDLILTAAWWFAFSISLFWSETSRHSKKSAEAMETEVTPR